MTDTCPACDEHGSRKDTHGKFYRCTTDDCNVTEYHIPRDR